jgi:hypothetical protein
MTSCGLLPMVLLSLFLSHLGHWPIGSIFRLHAIEIVPWCKVCKVVSRFIKLSLKIFSEVSHICHMSLYLWLTKFFHCKIPLVMDNFFKVCLCFIDTLNSLNWVLHSILGCSSLLAANPESKTLLQVLGLVHICKHRRLKQKWHLCVVSNTPL